jgi:hypothetical protein
MKRFAKNVAEYDMFGHVIALNFKREGDSHKTAIGGMFSFVIKLAMTLYVLMNLKKMFWNEDDSNSTEYNLEDLAKLPPISTRGTSFQLFHIIRKQVSGKMPKWEDEELRKNVDMYFVKTKYNWNVYPDPSYIETSEVKSR